MLVIAKYKRELLLVLAFAFIMRAGISIVTVAVNKSDSAFSRGDTGSYVSAAKSLIESQSFSIDGQPEIFRTPGYPLLLIPGILVGRIVFVTIGLQILISCLTVAIVFKLALELFNSLKIAMLAAILYGFEPMSLVYSNFLMSETLFTFCIALFLLCSVKYLRLASINYLIMASVALSASVYVRPIAYYLPWCVCIGLLLVMLIQRCKLKRIGMDVFIFFVISGTLIGAWQIRNYIRTGWSGFSSAGVEAFYSYYRPTISALQAGKTDDWDSGDLLVRRAKEAIAPLSDQEFEKLSVKYKYMRDQIVRRLWEYPTVALIQMLNLFDVKVPKGVVEEKIGKGLFEKRWLYLEKAPIYFWTDVFFGVWLWLCLIFVAVASVSREVWRSVPGVMILCLTGYFAFASASSQSVSRLRHPIMPFLCVLAAFGVYKILGMMRNRAFKTLLMGRVEIGHLSDISDIPY